MQIHIHIKKRLIGLNVETSRMIETIKVHPLQRKLKVSTVSVVHESLTRFRRIKCFSIRMRLLKLQRIRALRGVRKKICHLEKNFESLTELYSVIKIN